MSSVQGIVARGLCFNNILIIINKYGSLIIKVVMWCENVFGEHWIWQIDNNFEKTIK